jgi:hypothetical protein
MYRYLLQRSVNSTSNFQNYLYLDHPDTHAVDNNIQPGNLFAYRVAAMDSAGNLSSFSNFEAAGIPEIDWNTNIFTTGKDSFLTNSSFLNDPDNQISELQLSVSQENHVVISIQSNGIQISPSPINYLGQASFVLNVEDTDGYFDRKLIQISFYDPSLVFVFNIPDMIFDEDNSFQLLLDSTINSNPFQFEDIVWEFATGENLEYQYENSSHILTLQSSEENWYGEENIVIIANLPDQTTKTDSSLVVINPVNDPPQNLLQSLFVSPLSNNRFDLKLYALDVDNSPGDLDWTFSGYSDFSIQWYNFADKIIEIEVLDTSVQSETGIFEVSDPENASDTKQVTIYYSSQNTPPHLVNFPDTLELGEDSLLTFNLVNFFVDSTNNINEMDWEFETDANIEYSFNLTNYNLSVIPFKDWFGNSSIRIKISDPSGLSDQKIIPVRVFPRNDIENFQIRQYRVDAVRFIINTEIPSNVHLAYWHHITEKNYIEIDEFGVSHVIKLENLVSDTTYHFNLILTDTLGKKISISDSSFVVSLSFSISNDVIVYPNPVVYQNGDTRLIFDNLPAEPKKISIYNIIGQRVYEAKIQNFADSPFYVETFDDQTLNLASGLYVFMIEAVKSTNNKTGKFVIIK